MGLDSHFINAITSELEPQYKVVKGSIDASSLEGDGIWCSRDSYIVVAGLIGVQPARFFDEANPFSHQEIKEAYNKLKSFRHALHKSSSAMGMIKGVAFNNARDYVDDSYGWDELKQQVSSFTEREFIQIYEMFKYYAHVPYDISLVSCW